RNCRPPRAGTDELLVKNDEVMRVMKLMEAIFESAKTHQVVEFE
ncbi:MAG: gfo/Idh/MocA family oxidoreductase, partial [Lachnospiraceae bacterium]|nr:gfo/Idh/MocA family oxidoreductase [Lachnospiraceae bacterium]